MKKILVSILLSVCMLAQAADKLVVGASPTPHAELLEHLKPMLLQQGVDLEIKVYTDYVQPNVQLMEKRIDANFFQHQPYMNEFNKSRGASLQVVADVLIAPFGAYSKKITNISELRDGAVIAIPNDAVNGGRALQLLDQAKVIKLNDPKNNMATEKDILQNIKNIKIKQLEAPMLPRVLGEVDMAIINTTFALEAKLSPSKDALILESGQSNYVNLLAARSDNKDSPAMKKLAAALRSPESKKFILERFKGNLVPAF